MRAQGARTLPRQQLAVPGHEPGRGLKLDRGPDMRAFVGPEGRVEDRRGRMLLEHRREHQLELFVEGDEMRVERIGVGGRKAERVVGREVGRAAAHPFNQIF